MDTDIHFPDYSFLPSIFRIAYTMYDDCPNHLGILTNKRSKLSLHNRSIDSVVQVQQNRTIPMDCDSFGRYLLLSLPLS
jgi:hypothetical protein